MKKIVVVGSLNMDTAIETAHMPKAGETVSGMSAERIPGGKGANQAYAVGKLGGNVAMIGAVGDDSFGKVLKKNLETVNVDVSAVEEVHGGATGQAFIAVDERGENSIVIIAGANGKVDTAMIRRHKETIRKSDIVIMQMEIPLDVVEYVKDLALEMGKTIIIDPAPAVKGLPERFWKGVDYIKPNETELEILTGRGVRTRRDAEEAAGDLLTKGVKHVIVTMGGEGCLLVTEHRNVFFPANKVKAVDTTAAGDGFTAGFALALSKGKGCEEAIRFGQSVSSIVVTRKGAQPSIPTMEEVERSLLL